MRKVYLSIDPKLFVLFLLFTYNVLGIYVLGFNRDPYQIALTSVMAVSFQLICDRLFRGKFLDPTSALITSFGLSILVNYGHSYWYPLVPVFFAIGSKFFFTYKGKHFFNPALMGVVLSLLITNEFISAAPAYQWNGIGAMSLFIAMPAILLFMPRVNRSYIVLSFLGIFVIQLLLRSILIRHYLPFQTLFLGTITSPAFFLFTFFMITDPATTPNGKKDQIIAGIWLALLDLFFHLFKSYHTFFYAGLAYGGWRFINAHLKEIKLNGNISDYIGLKFFRSGYYVRFFSLIMIGFLGLISYKGFFRDGFQKINPTFKLESIQDIDSGLSFEKGEIYDEVDPRVQHMGKWILAITDGIAIADFNNDGLQDIFMTNGHKSYSDRNVFFLNQGEFKFKKIEFPAIKKVASSFKEYGVSANAMFVDYDSDGDKDLFITNAFGKKGTSRLFRNRLNEDNVLDFQDVTDEFGINTFTNSASANWFDFNNDGNLDLVIGNTIRTHLPDYKTPTHLDLFNLPQAEFEGDRRMFDFMHESWHMSNNGAANILFINNGEGFTKLDSEKIGMPETRWSMAIGTADFNRDGYVDLYVANDFGADDFYLNIDGKKFKNIKGDIFGSIGKDTYKGMNATILDYDRNGFPDVYISNVHHALQAEGSMLWAFSKDEKNNLEMKDVATFSGALNENRFGWGGAAGDLNNDGWDEILQANGMVDNKYDAKSDDCPDYWYINEKLARSPPSIHRYIDNWGDIRGMCIHGFEKNRLYLNRGTKKRPQFLDIADQVGMNQEANYRGISLVDFNNDGNLDVLISSLFRNPLLFKNNSTSQRDWIGIELESQVQECNREGAGSSLTLTFSDSSKKEVRIVKDRVIVNGFSAQSDSRIHFGLGEKATIKKLDINWCGRFNKSYTDLKKNQYQKIVLNML